MEIPKTVPVSRFRVVPLSLFGVAAAAAAAAAMSPPTARTQQGNAASQTPGPPQYAKVFVQRDYSDGTAVKFMTNFPQGLENKVRSSLFSSFYPSRQMADFHSCFVRTQIERSVFEYTVNQLNTYFAEAEKASCKTYCEGCFACFTVYTMFLCADTHYEKVNSIVRILRIVAYVGS